MSTTLLMISPTLTTTTRMAPTNGNLMMPISYALTPILRGSGRALALLALLPLLLPLSLSAPRLRPPISRSRRSRGSTPSRASTEPWISTIRTAFSSPGRTPRAVPSTTMPCSMTPSTGMMRTRRLGRAQTSMRRMMRGMVMVCRWMRAAIATPLPGPMHCS